MCLVVRGVVHGNLVIFDKVLYLQLYDTEQVAMLVYSSYNRHFTSTTLWKWELTIFIVLILRVTVLCLFLDLLCFTSSLVSQAELSPLHTDSDQAGLS